MADETEGRLEGDHTSDWALLSHWSSQAHLKVAESLVGEIKELMGWKMKASRCAVQPSMAAEWTAVTQSVCTIL